jgi:hypothetical protein
MRPECAGIPDIPDEVAERVSRGIDHFHKHHHHTWAVAITVADERFGSFRVGQEFTGPHDIVYGHPSKLGHGRDVAHGFCPRIYEDGELLTRCWLEAARVALLRVAS